MGVSNEKSPGQRADNLVFVDSEMGELIRAMDDRASDDG
jgi:hypothetical protein